MEGKFGQSVEAESAKNVKFKYTVGRERFDLRTFAPIATAHLYCAHHSLSTHMSRHFQAHALSRKLNRNIEPVT